MVMESEFLKKFEAMCSLLLQGNCQQVLHQCQRLGAETNGGHFGGPWARKGLHGEGAEQTGSTYGH